MTKPDRPGSFEDFDERLEKARPQQRGGPSGGEEPPPRLDYGTGLQAGIEVVAGVGLGTLLGWGLDRALGTRPLFLILLFMFGAVAGILNAYRHLRRMQKGA